jgi:hypothetical protein
MIPATATSSAPRFATMTWTRAGLPSKTDLAMREK